MTHLSEHFKQCRLQEGLSVSDLARLCGYRNLSKGCNKIGRFEAEGEIERGLFNKMAAILEVDQPTVVRLAELDRVEFIRQWNEWADERIEPHLGIRAIPGVMICKDIPAELTTQEQMEAFAADIAERFHKKVWLVLSRRVSIYFNESAAKRSVQHATPGEPVNSPYMRLAGSKKRFLFTADGGGLGVRPLNEPQQHGPGDK